MDNKLNNIINYFRSVYQSKCPSRFDNISIHLDSRLPIGGGLGSSSALCVGLAGVFYYSINKSLDKAVICEQAINAEKLLNRKTSGADCNICTFGGVGTYDITHGFCRTDVDLSDITLMAIDSGIKHDTYEMVKMVHKIKEKDPNLFSSICAEYEEVYLRAIKSLKNYDKEDLGNLMNNNQLLLSKLNLSNSLIDKIISICNSEGSLGTKITGAGGGGSIITLIDNYKPDLVTNLTKKMDELGMTYSILKIDYSGLRIRK